MKQTGVVVGIEGDKAKIRMQRHTACGDCGACGVSESQLKVTVEAENTVGAKTGDFVELDMETVDFLSAVVVVYLFPLIALIIGIFAGYYGILALGISDSMAQGFGAVIGILAAGLTYVFIRLKEDKLKGMKKYKPAITNIVDKEQE
ncbi:MAG: positive regulator of sigma RseC/MucC [Clostridia bacterium]|jgi:sigma-E factor negative regulatory protein RseC|nr:positive regulator of sigma RseC/MucC [Clostridia bacterium]